MKKRFSPLQRHLLAACMLLYATAYLNRLNLSAALGSVMAAFGLNATRAGMLPSAFAITYAVGQVLNGALVDRLNPVRHMCLGLIGSALCNLLMACSGGYAWLLALCLLNGAFQSMLWTPVVRLMAMHFGQEERPRANILLSITMIVGHLGAWAVSGYLSSILSWRASFAAPALFALPVVLVALLLLRIVPVEEASGPVKKQGRGLSIRRVAQVYWTSGFAIMLVSAVLFGFVRDGIRTWAPQILGEISPNAVDAATLSLIIPLINALGMAGSYGLQRMRGLRSRRIVSLLMAAGTVFCALLGGAGSVALCALLMGAACACMSGVEPLVTTLIPMEYDREGLIGLSAGLMDSLIYVGSALAGVTAGLIRESLGLNALFMGWAAAALLCALLSAGADGMLRRYRALSPTDG